MIGNPYLVPNAVCEGRGLFPELQHLRAFLLH